jgi:hypothetical protein
MAAATCPGMRGAVGLVGWLGLLIAVIALLHAVGGPLAPPPLDDTGSFRHWLEQREPAMVALAALRMVTLALAWYLSIVTGAALLATLLRARRLVRAVELVSLPPLRRLLNAALGLSLATTLSAPGMASARVTPPPTVQVPAGNSSLPTMRLLPEEPSPTAPSPPTPMAVDQPQEPSSPRPETPASAPPTTAPSATSTTAPPAPQAATTPPASARTPATPTEPPGAAPMATSTPREWTVRPGEHFWAVAEAVLAEAWRHGPSEGQVVPYWRNLMAANRDRLRDPGNPDLLFPGQVLVVPPPPAHP